MNTQHTNVIDAHVQHAIEVMNAKHACVASASIARERGHIDANTYEWLCLECDDLVDVGQAFNLALTIRDLVDDCLDAHAHLN